MGAAIWRGGAIQFSEFVAAEIEAGEAGPGVLQIQLHANRKDCWQLRNLIMRKVERFEAPKGRELFMARGKLLQHVQRKIQVARVKTNLKQLLWPLTQPLAWKRKSDSGFFILLVAAEEQHDLAHPGICQLQSCRAHYSSLLSRLPNGKGITMQHAPCAQIRRKGKSPLTIGHGPIKGGLLIISPKLRCCVNLDLAAKIIFLELCSRKIVIHLDRSGERTHTRKRGPLGRQSGFDIRQWGETRNVLMIWATLCRPQVLWAVWRCLGQLGMFLSLLFPSCLWPSLLSFLVPSFCQKLARQLASFMENPETQPPARSLF